VFGELPAMVHVMGTCRAVLVGHDGMTGNQDKRKRGDTCDANASFVSRGHPCCFIHYQADTAGPRAGKVEFKK
jgi:hypothetical protein